MIDWFKTNFQWILSGMGISCLVCLWVLCKKIIWRSFRNVITRRTVSISLQLSTDLMPYSDRFGLLHVRDGKDQLADSDRGPLLNRPRKISKVGEDTVRARVRFTRNIGFQFKFFLDPGDSLSYEDAKQLLENAGYTNVSPGLGVQGRIWFIHPDYGTCRTQEGFINNYYYPQ